MEEKISDTAAEPVCSENAVNSETEQAFSSETEQIRNEEKKMCPNCSFENAADAKFCNKCGMALSDGGETVVENTTNFTMDILKASFSQLWILSLVYFLFTCAFLVLIIVTDDKFLRNVLVFCAVIFLLLTIIFIAMYFKVMSDKRFKSDNKQIYYFAEDDIRADYFEHGEKNSSGIVHYSDVSNILRRKRVLLIYFLKNTHCYPVDIKSFTKGTEYDLYNLLKRKCSAKATKQYKLKQIVK